MDPYPNLVSPLFPWCCTGGRFNLFVVVFSGVNMTSAQVLYLLYSKDTWIL